MGTILYTTDPNATTGFREATFEELIAGARHALAIRVRKGTVMVSPKAARACTRVKSSKKCLRGTPPR